MAGTKYDKYFIEYVGNTHPLGPMISRVDDTVARGSYFYLVHWVMPKTNMDMSVGHPPHIHKYPELLFHIGTNPDDPMDLGAEVEIHMGPELERHIFTKSCVIYIPANFIHCPWKPVKTTRPWIFVEVNQGPMHTEKLYPQVLKKEIRDKVDWPRWKEEGFEMKSFPQK
jgi:hypothetical protein